MDRKEMDFAGHEIVVRLDEEQLKQMSDGDTEATLARLKSGLEERYPGATATVSCDGHRGACSISVCNQGRSDRSHHIAQDLPTDLRELL